MLWMTSGKNVLKCTSKIDEVLSKLYIVLSINA